MDMKAPWRIHRGTRRTILLRSLGVLAVLFMAGCDSPAVPETRISVLGEFVGTTPDDTRSRAFVGGLAPDKPCHCITWHVAFMVDSETQQPAGYTVTASYGLPGKNDPNQIEDGPTVKLTGKWEYAAHGTNAAPASKAYRMHGPNGAGSLALARVSEHLIHFLEDDQSLKLGNSGWSYTLNRKGIGREN